MKHRTISFIVFLFGMTILIAIGYRQLPNLFYLNDEWLTYGEVLTYGIQGFLATHSGWLVALGVGRPLGTLINNIYMANFPLNAIPFAITSYGMHFLNGLLIWILIYKITKSSIASTIGGLFFISVSTYHQSFSWMANAVQVSSSAFLSLISILLLIYSIEKKRNLFFYASWVSVYIAFLFKETSIFLFFFLPILYALFKRGVTVKELLKKHTILMIAGISLILYRLSALPSVTGISTGTISYWKQVAINILYYPIVSISQIFIPRDFMFRIAQRFGNQIYPNVMAMISTKAPIYENVVTDVLSLILSSVVIFFVLYLYIHKKKLQKNILIGMLFYFSTFIPLSTYLLSRGTAYIESRYMYLPVIAISFIVAILFEEILYIISYCKQALIRITLSVCFIGLFIFFLVKQSMVTNQEVSKNVSFGNETRQVLKEVKRLYPYLPDNSILYVTGDVSYYGLVNHRLPLQLGPGYIFQVIYFSDGTIPSNFIKNRFLWQLGSQGYAEQNGKAFGYFDNKEKLIAFMRKNSGIQTSHIIGLYYLGNDKKMIDISIELRKELDIQRLY